MKSLKFIVYAATLAIVVFTVFSRLTMSGGLIFLSFTIASALLFYMIYRVLKAPYTTQKTFSDWYEDKYLR